MSARPVHRHEVLALADAGVGYEEIGHRLGISPGLAYLIRTGIPADGSDAPAADARSRAGFLTTSQQLSNPQPAGNPTQSDDVLAWIRRRVEGDQQMRHAAAQRTATPGPTRRVEGPVDLVDVLTRDHTSSAALLKQLATIPGVKKGGAPARLSARKSIVDMVTASQAAHQTAEERYLWPLVRDRLEGGDELADQALEASGHGEDVLAALSRLEADQEEFDDLVEELTLVARKHVGFTAPLFLQLRERVDREELEELAKKVEQAEDTGPTRPHPDAPKRPPGVHAAARAAGVRDRARDAAEHRPAEREGRPAEGERGPEPGTEER